MCYLALVHSNLCNSNSGHCPIRISCKDCTAHCGNCTCRGSFGSGAPLPLQLPAQSTVRYPVPRPARPAFLPLDRPATSNQTWDDASARTAKRHSMFLHSSANIFAPRARQADALALSLVYSRPFAASRPATGNTPAIVIATPTVHTVRIRRRASC